jgi:hypothetical protein
LSLWTLGGPPETQGSVIRFRQRGVALLLPVLLAGCRSRGDALNEPSAATTRDPTDDAPAAGVQCAPAVPAPSILPGLTAEHVRLEYWLQQLGRVHDLDQPIVDSDSLRDLDASMAVARDQYRPPRDLLAPIDPDDLARKVEDRLQWARDKLAAGEFLVADGSAVPAADRAVLDQPIGTVAVEPELRVAIGKVPIRCVPVRAGFYLGEIDTRLDRNSCSTAAEQEVVQIIQSWPNGMKLAATSYSFGWIAADARLSPPLPSELRERFVRGPRYRVSGPGLTVRGNDGTEVTIAPGRLVPATADGRSAYAATSSGFVVVSPEQTEYLRPTRRDLTRRAVLEEAWQFVGQPYGLGGSEGGLDCSRFILDLFARFAVHLPRHSSWQARAGSFWIDVRGIAETERLLLLDAAERKGIVLLHFPGHIMLYLGRDHRGTAMVLHAFREYLEPWAKDATCTERLVKVPNVTVSTLELGRGTTRTSFLERITHITVIGEPPGVELTGAAQMRPVAPARIPADRRCRARGDATIIVSPERPVRGQRLRVIAATSDDPGPIALTLVDPSGEVSVPAAVGVGGPPYGVVAAVDRPRAGTWKAVLADGDRVVSCERFRVLGQPPETVPPNDGPIWVPERAWDRSAENLYSVFVERLFDYPMDEEQVWSNLHSLLRDSSRNIYFNHLGQGEDERLRIQPDCADLPYALRAYFAWKMKLPFGFRSCSRARNGRPPNCALPEQGDNLMSRLALKDAGGQTMIARNDVEAFSLFINGSLRRTVHSSSGRTLPEDDLTDFYPVALTREALRPGTLFADPYGHLLVVADWIPQGAARYGMMVGVDAQPDGTIGRRRFWRGSFLFDPAWSAGGAGFKAFRPRIYRPEPEPRAAPVAPLPPVAALTPATLESAGAAGAPPLVPPSAGQTVELSNQELRTTREFSPFSLQQYQGSKDEFYSAVEALINPRPLDAGAMQISLVDALAEAVTRRLTSVANGEHYLAAHGYPIIAMPQGAAIFLTSGAWEEYSTPSRDLRLLIAIDSVIGFPDQVRRMPARFGLSGPAEVEAEVARLKRLLAEQLGQRTLRYRKSNGVEHTLSLKDVADRVQRFEMAYNPNDCVEIRWGAPADSDEMASCQRRAPPEQRERMQQHRSWFSTRQRPPQ